MSKISTEQISFVVQGPIIGSIADEPEKQFTRLCCENIRKHFPGAEIVLSTWKGSAFEHISYDVVVENEDPGAYKMTLNGEERYNNTNRMIVSTINGLKKASRQYCVRMRSDMSICSSRICELLGKYNKGSDGKIFDERVVTLSAINPHRSDILYAVNDWFYFGKTTDLINLYDIPLQQVSDLNVDEETGMPLWEDNVVAEQYIWTSFLKKSPYYKDRVNLSKMKQSSLEELVTFEESIISNLIFTNAYDIGLNSFKFPNRNYVTNNFLRMSCYSVTEWLLLYKKNVDSKVEIPFILKDRIDLLLYKTMYFVMAHFKGFYKLGRFIYNKLRKS